MQRLEKRLLSVDRLSLRERLFLLAASLFVVGGLWEAVLAAPLAAREQLANDKVTALQTRLVELDASLSAAAAGVSEGVPDQLARLQALRESVRARAVVIITSPFAPSQNITESSRRSGVETMREFR